MRIYLGQRTSDAFINVQKLWICTWTELLKSKYMDLFSFRAKYGNMWLNIWNMKIDYCNQHYFFKIRSVFVVAKIFFLGGGADKTTPCFKLWLKYVEKGEKTFPIHTIKQFKTRAWFWKKFYYRLFNFFFHLTRLALEPVCVNRLLYRYLWIVWIYFFQVSTQELFLF